MWTSIATGKLPERHGVTGFQTRDADGYTMRLVRSSDRKGPAFWNITSHYGVRSTIVNWLVTHPAEPIAGTMVSRLEEIDEQSVHPASLKAPLAAAVAAISPAQQVDDSEPSRWRKFLTEQLDRLIVAERVVSASEACRLSVYYTHSTDEIQHRFWKYMDPDAFTDEFFRVEPEILARYKDTILEHYQRIDQWIGETWDDESEVLFLVSDHGAQAATRPRIYLDANRVLSILGFASLDDTGSPRFEQSSAFDCTENPWDYRVRICVNLVGSERSGVVEASELESVRSRIAASLRSIRLTNGEAVVAKVTMDTEASSLTVEPVSLSGRHLTMAIVADAREIPLRDVVRIHDISGDHGEYGILAIAGGPVRIGRIESADLLDVAPTLLHLLGLPIADDIDGELVTAIFDPGYLKANPVRRVASYDSIERGPILTARGEENESLKERLRSLGYIQ
jgi:predicted AlkP superfamily phosphohydrolase/phosphomutase